MVSIETLNDTRIAVSSPFHPDFPAKARSLGGKWRGTEKTWAFDARDEQRVRDLCIEIWGTDGSPASKAELVTVRLPFNHCEERGNCPISAWFAGREIAVKHGRDSRPRLGDNVVIVAGGEFPTSGGSVRYPGFCVSDKLIVEIRDLPRTAADAAIADLTDGQREDVVIVDETVDHEALKQEREELLARIAEINELLGEGPARALREGGTDPNEILFGGGDDE